MNKANMEIIGGLFLIVIAIAIALIFVSWLFSYNLDYGSWKCAKWITTDKSAECVMYEKIS